MRIAKWRFFDDDGLLTFYHDGIEVYAEKVVDALNECESQLAEAKVYIGKLERSIPENNLELARVSLELASTQARLAGYEVGYDPKVRLPDDDEQVITFVNSKNWCFSNKDILSYLLKRHYLTDSTRWFPLPGSKEDE